MEHQYVIGLSLPSYFDCRKPVKCDRFQSLETARQGSLPLVRAASGLISTPFVETYSDSANCAQRKASRRVSTRHARVRTPRFELRASTNSEDHGAWSRKLPPLSPP